MGGLTVATLKTVIAVALAGSVVVQVGIVLVAWLDADDARLALRIPLALILVLGVGTLQVTGVCVWRLLTMVRRGTVFSHAAFRYVDTVIGAIGSGAVLVFGIAVVAAYANRTTSGDEVAPGLVGLVCGAALVVGGVALVVLVLRALLVQAVAWRTELDAVV